MASSGRILYASAIIGFGVLCLIYVDFVNQLQPVNEFLSPPAPLYSFLAILTGATLIAAGLAIAANYRIRVPAIVLMVMFMAWIALLHIPSAFNNPVLLRSPWWVRTFETLALAGAALILAGSAGYRAHKRWTYAGRILFGISLPVFGILHFVYPAYVALLVAASPVAYPWPLFWAYLTGAGHAAAGVAIATGILPRLAAMLAGMMYASWALTLHLPRVIAGPAVQSAENPAGFQGFRPELTSLFVCIAFWGAAWIVAGSLVSSRRQAATGASAHENSVGL